MGFIFSWICHFTGFTLGKALAAPAEWVCWWVNEGTSERVSEWVSEWVGGWLSEWVSEWVSNLTAFLGHCTSSPCIPYKPCINAFIAYTFESLSSLIMITHNLPFTNNFNKNEYEKWNREKIRVGSHKAIWIVLPNLIFLAIFLISCAIQLFILKFFWLGCYCHFQWQINVMAAHPNFFCVSFLIKHVLPNVAFPGVSQG